MDPKNVTFRTHIAPEDIEHVREIITSSGFFYDFEIPVAVELAEDGVNEGDDSGYFFVFAEIDGKTIAYSCYGHIAGTDAGYDLYWIATHNNLRGTGIGKLLLEKTEQIVKEKGARYLVAETSTTEKYLPTRLFYEKNNYEDEAYIRDYYKPGDGKVIYVKRLV
jgi:ribosomal protein S18 acetylase RimI-like enzyme